VGEALVSLLDSHGRPGVVERAYVIPPGCRIGSITPEERAAVMRASPLASVYDQSVDRESAYEKLLARQALAGNEGGGVLGGIFGGGTAGRASQRESAFEAAARSAARAIGSGIGREIVRGVLGSLLGGQRRR
jgi:uncharacterized protein